MTYIIEPVKLDSKHPLWPGETVFYIIDIITGRFSLGCYTSYEAADKMLTRKRRINLSVLD